MQFVRDEAEAASYPLPRARTEQVVCVCMYIFITSTKNSLLKPPSSIASSPSEVVIEMGSLSSSNATHGSLKKIRLSKNAHKTGSNGDGVVIKDTLIVNPLLVESKGSRK